MSTKKIRKGYYRHYKGQHYEVIGVGQHSETREKLVFYRALYGDFGLWARPLEMFASDVELDGEKKARFEFIKES